MILNEKKLQGRKIESNPIIDKMSEVPIIISLFWLVG